jgi:7,8-dihydropterin-6-yl-methyl-4-(beta-D-ribofuranosyl)aminobenzene 5'-phosphate synthase
MPRIVSLLFAALALSQADVAFPGPCPSSPAALRIMVLFNNVPHRLGLTAGWGFSCLIEGLTAPPAPMKCPSAPRGGRVVPWGPANDSSDKTLLFDTGADGAVLLADMRRMGLSPKDVDAVFRSHIHADHTGGLDALLAERGDVDVWLPAAPIPASSALPRRRNG